MKLPVRLIMTISVCATLAAVPLVARSERARPAAARSVTTITRAPAAPVGASAFTVDFEERHAIEAVAYQAAVEQQLAADAYQAAVDAALAAQAALRTSRSVNSGYHPGTTVGECTGFVIPDYIIMRESGGNPSAYNPSGAYGCAQTLLSHYSTGSCAGLDPYTIQGQRDCVQILYDRGGLNPWNATR